MKLFHGLILVFLATYFFALYISHCAMVLSGQPSSLHDGPNKNAFYTLPLANQTMDPFQSNSHRTYVERSLTCPACRITRTGIGGGDKRMTCEQAVQRYLDSHNATPQTALHQIMIEYDACREACREDCSDSDRVTRLLYRMDDMAPPLRNSRTFYLQSVPSTHRVPKEALSDLDSFFADKENVYPQRSYYFEYNPSIVKIPDGYELPKSLNETPIYLASFRLATTQQCITGSTQMTMFGGSYPYPADDNALGIALLRADLSVITDVAVNMKPLDKYVQDYRVFSFDNQLYLSSHYFIRPFWLVPPLSSDPDVVKLKLKHKFHSDARRSFDVFIRQFPSCTRYKEGKRNGKNLNFFKDPVTHEIMMELRPMGPKIRIDLDKPCEHDAVVQEPHVEPPLDAASEATFRTMEERYYGDAVLFKGDRGSACCVSFPDPRNPHGPNLLLGISHAKTLKGPVDGFANQYASRFYAMESARPYKVVAFTGRFCLGFPSESESDNPYARLNLDSVVMGEPIACPRIHFISGMVEKADDPSQLLIAYGVNDCAPRIVQVSKDYVVRLLFPEKEWQLK